MSIFSASKFGATSWREILKGTTGTELRKKTFSWVLIFASYLLTAQIGSFLYRDIGTSPALIWPPVGIALAAVLIEGYWIASAIALGAFLNAFLNGAPFFIIIGSVLANTIQPIIGGFVLRKLRFNPLMNTLHDVFLMLSVATIGTSIMPLINYVFSVSYNYFFDASRAVAPWPSIWIGGALSALVLTPFLARWIGRDITNRTKLQQLEVLVSVLLVAFFSYVLFVTPITSFFGTSILLLLIGALFWISFRVGPRVMSLALLLMTAISIAGAIYGIHAPSAQNQTLSERLISTEVFDLIIAFFFFLFVSVEEQRKEALRIASEEAARLEHALEKIRGEDQAKNDFIATLAHELRNPLAPVMSGLELLGIGEKNPDKLEIIESAKRQSLIMRRLLDELLDVSRVTRNAFVLQKNDVSLQDILRQSIRASEHFYKERGHVFTSTIPDETLWVSADTVRLSQVFTNVLYNAGKYTEPGGVISLTLEKDDAGAVIRVRDNGIGIPKDMLMKIFDPFVQNNTDYGLGTGLGIGLSIAKRMVELHEGTICAESAGKGTGSTFTIRLPLLKTPTLTRPPETAPSSVPVSILVVDDNIDAAGAISKLLKLRGHTVTMTHSGRDALALLDSTHRILLLDIGLPDIDGHEVARLARSQFPALSIIALSGYGSDDRKPQTGVAPQMDAYLTKPASIQDIDAVLSSLMKERAELT